MAIGMSSSALSLAPTQALEAERAEAAEAFLVLSFDVEEHHRIEAAAGLSVPSSSQAEYGRRMEATTRWLLEQLAATRQKATFFILGEIGRSHPHLVRDIHDAGHEVASHGWNHQRLHHLTPASLAEDLRLSRNALEDATGAPVYGYRAPTFSVVRETAWAVDVLGEFGVRYDSSIYPVRHDRYGVPEAPRAPFRVRGVERELLELPPVSWRFGKYRLPVGGGGYFRIFPSRLMHAGIAQTIRECVPPVGMLYFHPWEFDLDQPRLRLSFLQRMRTYAGMRRTRSRLTDLLSRYRFGRAIDVAERLSRNLDRLPSFALSR
jgi:polysaccharide deacetylase family protein (PEP-CTERM system associated)